MNIPCRMRLMEAVLASLEPLNVENDIPRLRRGDIIFNETISFVRIWFAKRTEVKDQMLGNVSVKRTIIKI